MGIHLTNGAKLMQRHVHAAWADMCMGQGMPALCGTRWQSRSRLPTALEFAFDWRKLTVQVQIPIAANHVPDETRVRRTLFSWMRLHA